MGVGLKCILTVCQKCTNAGHATGVQVNNAQVAKAGLGEDNTGNNQNGTGDQSTNSVGENMLKHNPAVSCAQGASNQDILLILKAVELHSGTSGHACPTCQEEGNEQHQHVGNIQVVLQQRNNDHKVSDWTSSVLV